VVKKYCWTCKEEKPLEAFNVDRSRKSGLNNRCRKCCATHGKEYYSKIKDTPEYRERKRKSSAEYIRQNPERQKARELAGKNDMKPNCEWCSATEKLHRHHPDYSKPLEVVTLCVPCHEKAHHGVLV
jgi:hypothetical protein